MKPTVKQVVGFLILAAISNGCTKTANPFGCDMPDVKEATYDNSHKETLLEESTKCYMNFLLAKQEIDNLRAAMEVCR